MKWPAAALTLALVGCGSDSRPRWEIEIAYAGDVKLGGCAIGDADPDSAGNEIVAVSERAEAILLRRGRIGWTHEVLAHLRGELVQCAIGNADPSRPGHEIVAVGVKQGGEDDGSPGVAVMLYREGGAWKNRVLLEDMALLHSVCIGDIDPDHEGEEVFVGGYSMRGHVLANDRATSIPLPGPAKSAVVYRGGVAVACKDGSVVHVRKEGGEWKVTLVDKAGAGQSRIGTDGARLIVSRDDGVLALLDGGKRTQIFADSAKLRGAALVDMDPASPGFEAATAGYGKTVTVISAKGKAETVHVEKDRIHHLAAGELPPGGRALVVCGYSGRTVTIRRTGR